MRDEPADDLGLATTGIIPRGVEPHLIRREAEDAVAAF